MVVTNKQLIVTKMNKAINAGEFIAAIVKRPASVDRLILPELPLTRQVGVLIMTVI
jgi:hypothetical protein